MYATLSDGTFVPNDVFIGESDHARFILLTGPNMGGNSSSLFIGPGESMLSCNISNFAFFSDTYPNLSALIP